MNFSYSRFLADRSGNFGMILGVMSLPLVAVVGMSIDYATMSSTRTKLQSATDAASLAVAREGPWVKDADAIVRRSLAANMPGTSTTFDFKREGAKVIVNGTTPAGTYFDRFMGKSWTVSTRSVAYAPSLNFEIGFVLDTTGSMEGTKLEAMKEAVSKMITTMSAQVKEADKLKFAVVPFSTMVNVGEDQGPSFDARMKQVEDTGARWLDLAGAAVFPQSELSSGASRFQVFKNLGRTWNGCVEARFLSGTNVDVDDTPPNPGRPNTLYIPSLAPDEPDGRANSYLTSSIQPYDNSTAARRERWAKYGVATSASGQPLLGGLLNLVGGLLSGLLGGEQPAPKAIEIDDSISTYWDTPKGPGAPCTTQPIQPLTSNTKTVLNSINSLQAAGNTNITEGVAWGMRVLSPGEPFAEGLPYNASVRKVLIVLTDGANTLGVNAAPYNSHYSAYGYLADGRISSTGNSKAAMGAAMNLRTQAACDVAKNAGFEIYTIRLEEPDASTGDLLSACASSPQNYFDVPDSAQLDKAFESIRDTLLTVRLTH